jgi:hypothetical protein
VVMKTGQVRHASLNLPMPIDNRSPSNGLDSLLQSKCSRRWLRTKRAGPFTSIADTAAQFFDCCETGKGWEGCEQFCHSGATFSAQVDALAGITTVKDYTEWMKGLLEQLPDGTAAVRAFAVDEARNDVAVFGVFRGTHTGEGGPVPPTGRARRRITSTSWSSRATRSVT